MKALWHWLCAIGCAVSRCAHKQYLRLAIATPILVVIVALTHQVLPTTREIAAFGLLTVAFFAVALVARYFVRELSEELKR